MLKQNAHNTILSSACVSGSRRQFLKNSSAALALAAMPPWVHSKGKAAHVIVIGGGFGGASAAKYIKKIDPAIEVTLIEVNKNYTTCPGSNWVIGGLRDLKSITFGYEQLKKNYGLNVVHGWVETIDPQAHQVVMASGEKLSYDRLIVSPGIDFRFDTIEGYDAQVAQTIPHAWQAGEQTRILLQQLKAMKDGGKFVITPPPNPFRCPPGPYERVSLVANYLKNNKPKSKIIIADAKARFSKQKLFEAGWKKYFGYGSDKSMIEWIHGPEGRAVAVDAANKTVTTEFGETIQADVLNVVPAQKAGKLAFQAGLVNDSGWCPVNPLTCESTLHPDIHVIGDASIQKPLPKSGFAATSEAKVCAAAVVQLLHGKDPNEEPLWINTCYSLITANHGISVAMVYKYDNGKIIKVKGAGGVTRTDLKGRKAKKLHFLEARFGRDWYESITEDTFM